MSFGGVRVRAFLPRSWQVIYPTGKKKPFAREEISRRVFQDTAELGNLTKQASGDYVWMISNDF
jgi:hypothetical protein